MVESPQLNQTLIVASIIVIALGIYFYTSSPQVQPQAQQIAPQEESFPFIGEEGSGCSRDPVTGEEVCLASGQGYNNAFDTIFNNINGFMTVGFPSTGPDQQNTALDAGSFPEDNESLKSLFAQLTPEEQATTRHLLEQFENLQKTKEEIVNQFAELLPQISGLLLNQ